MEIPTSLKKWLHRFGVEPAPTAAQLERQRQLEQIERARQLAKKTIHLQQPAPIATGPTLRDAIREQMRVPPRPLSVPTDTYMGMVERMRSGIEPTPPIDTPLKAGMVARMAPPPDKRTDETQSDLYKSLQAKLSRIDAPDHSPAQKAVDSDHKRVLAIAELMTHFGYGQDTILALIQRYGLKETEQLLRILGY